MNLLFRIISDSFAVLGRNFVLLYPLLFFSLLLSVLIPQTTEQPTLDVKWVSLLSVLFLLFYAFTAGWFKMIYTGIQSYLKPKPVSLYKEVDAPTGDPFLEPFRLFKDFFPGVGEFFGPFALGGALQVSVLLLVAVAVYYLTTEWIGLPPGLDKLATLKTDAEVDAFLNSLTFAEKSQWGQISFLLLGAMLSYGVFYLVTMFWAPFIIVHRVGALKAYGLSIVQFFKDPFRIIAIGLFYCLLLFVSFLFLQLNSTALAVLMELMLAILKTYFSILLVMYVAQVNPGPATTTDSETQPPALPT